MFETLFRYPGPIRRHREGPLAAERSEYLSELAAQGVARGTLLRRASYCLCVAVELQHWSADQCFDEAEVEALAAAWAANRSALGRASSPRWPKQQFQFAATDFLRSLGRLRLAEAPAPRPYDAELAQFIAAQQEGRWLSEATCQSAKWQVRRFLDYLEQRGIALGDIAATDIDAFYELVAQRCNLSSERLKCIGCVCTLAEEASA